MDWNIIPELNLDAILQLQMLSFTVLISFYRVDILGEFPSRRIFKASKIAH